MTDRYVGLWQRELLEDGPTIDRTTRVYWLQAAEIYCDLRVPSPRPIFNGPSLAHYSDEQLEWLLQQEGFAGRLEVKNETECHWHREMDFQPDRSVIDAGRMRFAGELVIEKGIHRPYLEEWRHTKPFNDTLVALELITEESGGVIHPRRGFLVVVGDWFMYGCDRVTPLPAAPSLHHLLNSAADKRAALLALCDCEISFGIRTEESAWRITLSTLPFREGEILFAPGQWPRFAPNGECVQRLDKTVRHWHIHQWSRQFQW